MTKFIGRTEELAKLREFTHLKKSSFLVIKGRRRIGKSRLIKEFGKDFSSCFIFSGLAPDEKTTSQHQLDEFSRQMALLFKSPLAKYDDWTNAFWSLSERVKKGKILLVFDEISWMGSKDPTFLSKIKNFWDLHLSTNSHLIFIVCGSASSWIDKNILSSTGFVGRVSYTMTVDELPLSECAEFWPSSISAYEKLKILSVTGGVPKYLEEINPKLSAEENIKRLCFMKGGLLVDEFNKIFSDVFLRNSEVYKKSLIVLSAGAKELKEIQQKIPQAMGRLSEYLKELESGGFIARDYTWDVKDGIDSKLSRFRLKDNYVRFYFKYIQKNLTKINRDAFALKSLSSLPEWEVIMGLQFENLVIRNKTELHKHLNLNPQDIVSENPFFQRRTKIIPGCQIDYLIQTKFKSLYVCEIKFLQEKIGSTIIAEVQKKIDSIQYPKGFSVRPVLIHVNGVSQKVIEADYFSDIIDVSDFLKTSK